MRKKNSPDPGFEYPQDLISHKIVLCLNHNTAIFVAFKFFFFFFLLLFPWKIILCHFFLTFGGVFFLFFSFLFFFNHPLSARCKS